MFQRDNGSSEVDVSGIQWLAVFVPSVSKESECDDAVNCI